MHLAAFRTADITVPTYARRGPWRIFVPKTREFNDSPIVDDRVAFSYSKYRALFDDQKDSCRKTCGLKKNTR
jgi:hypothetical protein